MRVEFRRKEPEVNASECVVEKTIVLPEKEYQDFASHLMRNYDFIRDNVDLMYERDDIWHCLLVAGEQSREGVLVESEGSSYARYSAILPDASAFMQKKYKALEELNEKLKDAVEFIIREGTQASTNGSYIAHSKDWTAECGIDEAWGETVYDMLSEREEVQEVCHLGEDFEICFYTQYCPKVMEEAEMNNQNMSL